MVSVCLHIPTVDEVGTWTVDSCLLKAPMNSFDGRNVLGIGQVCGNISKLRSHFVFMVVNILKTM
jgi:hypothetical protein